MPQKVFAEGFFFGVVVPVPDFDAVAGGVGYDGAAVEGGVVAEEDGVLCVEAGDLEFVDLCHFEEGFADFGFRCEAGLVDVLAAGFEFFGDGGDGVSCAG